MCTGGGGGEQRFTGRGGGGAQRQQPYRPQVQKQSSMEGVASMEQDTDSTNDGVIMVRIYYNGLFMSASPVVPLGITFFVNNLEHIVVKSFKCWKLFYFKKH